MEYAIFYWVMVILYLYCYNYLNYNKINDDLIFESNITESVISYNNIINVDLSEDIYNYKFPVMIFYLLPDI